MRALGPVEKAKPIWFGSGSAKLRPPVRPLVRIWFAPWFVGRFGLGFESRKCFILQQKLGSDANFIFLGEWAGLSWSAILGGSTKSVAKRFGLGASWVICSHYAISCQALESYVVDSIQ